MKNFLLAALATTMLAMPVASVQAAPLAQFADKPAQVHLVKAKPGERFVEKKVVRKVVRTDRFGRKIETRRSVSHRWTRGNRLPHWQRQQVVRDYRHYGLRRPGAGQHWLKVNNEYLLVGIASGIIASVIGAN